MRVAGVVALAVGGALVAACSPAEGSRGAGGDAASGPQPVGEPCDPGVAAPCLPAGDPCILVQCDPVARVCAERAADAGPLCNGGGARCATSADCDLGLVCGFPLAGGCGAPGTCIDPPLPCQADAAACGGGGTACGCSAAPVPIVIPGFAAAPVSSPGGCEPGPTTPGDGGEDAPADAAAADAVAEE